MLTNIHENSWEHFLFSLCLRKWWFNSSVRWRFSFLSLRDTEKEMVRHNTACLFWQKNTAANSNKNCYHCFFCLIFLLFFFFFLITIPATYSFSSWAIDFYIHFIFACCWLTKAVGRIEFTSHILPHPSLTKMHTLYVWCIISSTENNLPQETKYDTRGLASPGEWVAQLYENEAS